MHNTTDGDILCFLGGECEGGEETGSVHTPQTEQTGDTVSKVPAAEEPSNKEREERFRSLMEGEFKDLFTAYFQATFNRRFKEHKQMSEELESARTLKAAAAQRYGTEDTEALLAAIRAEEKQTAPTEAAVASTVLEQARAEREQRAAELEQARTEACRELLESIRARGMRPCENGLSGTGGTMRGVAGMTREERAELARRAAKGEQISL